MTDAPARVRVELSGRRGAGRSGTIELAEQGRVGGILLRRLIRTQLGLSLALAAVIVLALGGLPLLVHWVPAASGVLVAGLPVAWLLLGLVIYPLTVGLAWIHVKLASRIEREFTELFD